MPVSISLSWPFYLCPASNSRTRFFSSWVLIRCYNWDLPYLQQVLNDEIEGIDDGEKRALLNRLKSLFLPQPSNLKKSNILILWHGCSPSAALSICKGGAKDLRTTDGGYFGSGIYLTPNLDYAYEYSKNHQDQEGNSAVLLCKVTIARTYPISRKTDYQNPDSYDNWSICKFHSAYPIPQEIIDRNNSYEISQSLKKRMDKSLKSGFDSHFIGVSSQYSYQAVSDDQAEFYELVVKDEAQILPIGILYFRKQ